jgi:glutamyl-tRNA synthetase|tara:strand:- start:1491 stop:3125 length:1635 start_codon:yes stop_codon:yes gene_type:complete
MNKKEIEKYVLDNAVNYGGKANINAVAGHFIGKYPEVKKDMKKFMKKLSEIIKNINSMSLEKQKEELEKLGSVEKVKRESSLFDFLNIKKGNKVVTAFPPEPSKYLHIGHAKSLLLNYLLAKEYNGKFILRFEDTNPELVDKKFYDIILKDVEWLGVKTNKIQYASDHIDLFYDYGKKLIESGDAYVCYCKSEEIKSNRRKGISCECRDIDEPQNLKNWIDFFKAKSKSCVVRFKIDMSHKNAVMRDPTIFRIVDKIHPRVGKQYRVWPTYEFQNSIMDGYFGITHRLRGKEFESMAELQKYIQKLLDLTITKTYEFARFNMKGILSSGRVIREKIKKKELSGWDDPKLTTLIALRRRGFLPRAIEDFVVSTGISKAEATMTWEDLIIKNKRLIDDLANRYFFVQDPKKIKISGFVGGNVEIPLHLSHPNRGTRKLKVKNEFYVADKLVKSKNYRFMHLFNFKDEKFVSEELNKSLKATLIHWLPVSKDLMKIEILMDGGEIVKGLAEKDVKKLKIGDIIQFERFGFVRLDKKGKVLKFIFTHK